MIGFDQSGNLKLSVPNYYPLKATSDAGVIAQSADGLTVATFDQNGIAIAQLPALPTQSWTGSTYQPDLAIEAVAYAPASVADASFWPQAGANPSQNGVATQPVTKDVRDLIAQIALGKKGSTNWLDQVGHNQCNIFVHDVLKEAGLNPPQSSKSSAWWRAKYYLGLVDSQNYPAQAGDWANPQNTLTCWWTVPSGSDGSMPGDVLAEAIQYSDATGHVGIVVGLYQTASADSAVSCYDPNHPPAGTITISDYGFRPDNWVDPITWFDPNTGTYKPCRTHGYARHAVVKRFVCQ